MFGMRMPELLLLLVIVLVIFGAKGLPKLGRSLGEALRGFRRSAEGEAGETPMLGPATEAAGPVAREPTACGAGVPAGRAER